MSSPALAAASTLSVLSPVSIGASLSLSPHPKPNARLMILHRPAAASLVTNGRECKGGGGRELVSTQVLNSVLQDLYRIGFIGQ